MYPFDLLNPIPPDVVIAVQLGAGRVFYYAVVLAAAALALTIAYESLHDHGDNRFSTPPKEADSPSRRAA